MDRKISPRPLDPKTVYFDRIITSHLLLPRCPRKHFQPHPHEAHRRDLHLQALQWFPSDHGETSTGGIPSQPEANTRIDANHGTSRNSARAQHIQKPPTTHQVPVPLAGSSDFTATGGLEHRHHLHSAARRVYLPHSSHRLVQSAGFVSSSFEQLRGHLLHRSRRRGNRTLREADHFQYRSRSAVFFQAVCRRHSEQRNPLQHGWTRPCPRQRVCGTPLEIRQA